MQFNVYLFCLLWYIMSVSCDRQLFWKMECDGSTPVKSCRSRFDSCHLGILDSSKQRGNNCAYIAYVKSTRSRRDAHRCFGQRFISRTNMVKSLHNLKEW